MNICSTKRAPQQATRRNSPSPQGHGHDHSPKHGKALIPMDAVHAAHDVAMIGMNMPGHHHHHAMEMMGEICGPNGIQTPNPGLFDGFANGTTMHQGLTVLSAAAAAGATYHGVRMLGHGHYSHAANHLLMGAGSATMALGMATNSSTLNRASSVLMGAHGAVEAGLGIQSLLKAESNKGKALALTSTVHGACLAAAQFTNNASIAIPLYLGMGAATAVKIALEHSA